MKLSLQLKLGQQLTMTPQLQQAIKLLQLSTLDLQQEIHEALESNPMLELDEENQESANSQDVKESTDNTLNEDKPGAADSNGESDWQEDIPGDLSVDSTWDDVYPQDYSGSTGFDGELPDFESRNSAEETLQDHLMWQLNLTPMSETDEIIALSIIDSIDSNGMLTTDIETIHQGLESSLEIDVDEVLAVLHRIQQFDPIGVGYRDLAECLLIQLSHYNALENPEPIRNARRIIEDYLGLLGTRDYAQLMRKMRIKEPQLKEAIAIIESLNPRPGASISPSSASYIVPDVIVKKKNGQWSAELNPDTTPKLRINSSYKSLIKRADSSDDNTFLKNNLQEANWFLKSLQSRNETLLKVASRIVDHQKGFLDYGEEAMKPLVLHDIAEAVEMHESTISRVTTQKYMHTPRGIFELKYFFSSHVSTQGGGECSSTAIRAIIKKLIAAENARKPLSDSKITEVLKDQGINVARRTIAKYRESMAIPPSNERKRLAD